MEKAMLFQIIRTDITKMQLDAIVNPANPMPGYAAGIDSAVYKAAKKLTKLACEWAESDEEAAEITEESFAKRISLSLIWMTSGGSFSAYFDDDDLFFGHSITVCGSPKKGLLSADIEG